MAHSTTERVKELVVNTQVANLLALAINNPREAEAWADEIFRGLFRDFTRAEWVEWLSNNCDINTIEELVRGY